MGCLVLAGAGSSDSLRFGGNVLRALPLCIDGQAEHALQELRAREFCSQLVGKSVLVYRDAVSLFGSRRSDPGGCRSFRQVGPQTSSQAALAPLRRRLVNNSVCRWHLHRLTHAQFHLSGQVLPSPSHKLSHYGSIARA